MSLPAQRDEVVDHWARPRWRSVVGLACLTVGFLAAIACTTLLFLADRLLVVVDDGYLEPALAMPWLVAAAGTLALLGWATLRGTESLRAWTSGICLALPVSFVLAFCAVATRLGLFLVFVLPMAWPVVPLAVLGTVNSFLKKGRDLRAGRAVPPQRGQAAVAALIVVTMSTLVSNAILVNDDSVTVDRADDKTTIVRVESLFWQDRTTVYQATPGSRLAHRESVTVIEK